MIHRSIVFRCSLLAEGCAVANAPWNAAQTGSNLVVTPKTTPRSFDLSSSPFAFHGQEFTIDCRRPLLRFANTQPQTLTCNDGSFDPISISCGSPCLTEPGETTGYKLLGSGNSLQPGATRIVMCDDGFAPPRGSTLTAQTLICDNGKFTFPALQCYRTFDFLSCHNSLVLIGWD